MPHQKQDGKWYFWDEAGVEELGPYDTEQHANLEAHRYGVWLKSRDPRPFRSTSTIPMGGTRS